MKVTDLSPVTLKEELAASQALVKSETEQVQTDQGSDDQTTNTKKFKEEAYLKYVDGRSYVEISRATATKQWDGTALREDIVYHENDLGGLPILWIESNRRTYKRALKMQRACHDKGMTTPAVLVRAELARDWRLKLIDPATQEVVPNDQIDGCYCVMEGHGRHYASLIEKAQKDGDPDYQPYDFKFVFAEYDSAEAFGNAYLSCNEDMTRTSNKDRMKVAAARCTNPLVKRFIQLIKDGVIAKAASLRVYGRELSAVEANAITKELTTAPKFNLDLTDALARVYDTFKETFACEGAEKIYRGVPAAKWSADKISEAKDKAAMADLICSKLKTLSNAIYTGLITAKSHSKKHITRDQIIQDLLDKMMK